MPNPFRPKPQRRFDPHRFQRLSDFLETNHIDWESFLAELLIGFAPAPFVYGGSLYVDRADTSLFRQRLQAESLRRVAELIDATEILEPEAVVGAPKNPREPDARPKNPREPDARPKNPREPDARPKNPREPDVRPKNAPTAAA